MLPRLITLIHGHTKTIGDIRMPLVKNLIVIVASLLFSSCFYFDKAERLSISGNLDGQREYLDNYELEYFIDGKLAEINVAYRDWNFKWNPNGKLKWYAKSYCNVFFKGGDIWGCTSTLRGMVDFEIYLKNKKNGNKVLLAKKKIDMDAYYRSVLLTQVYFGTDKERYIERKYFNVDWNKMQPFVFKDSNDTLYHYTAWYWDKRDVYEKDFPDERYFIEIP